MPLFVNDSTPVMITSGVCMVLERRHKQVASTVNTWSSASVTTPVFETHLGLHTNC